MRSDLERFKALIDYPLPTSVKEMDRLIGFFAYYAKWIPKCTDQTHILTTSRSTFSSSKGLSQECIDAIEILKAKLKEASLASPIPNEPLEIETDASDYALGGILSQKGRPIAYFSRELNNSEKNHSLVEKEAGEIFEFS